MNRWFCVAYQACASGSSRPKWTVLAANHKFFRKICRTCPGKSQIHKHLPWRVVHDKFRNPFCNFRRDGIPTSLSCRNCFGVCRSFERKRMDSTSRNALFGSDCIVGQMPCSNRHSTEVFKAGAHTRLSIDVPLSPWNVLKKPLVIESQCEVSPVSPNFNEIPSESQLLRFTPLRSRGGSYHLINITILSRRGVFPTSPMSLMQKLSKQATRST